MTLYVSIGCPVRVIVGLLIASTKAVLALDRMAFSFFTVAMASEFDWSTADQGRVKAAFSFGSVPLLLIRLTQTLQLARRQF